MVLAHAAGAQPHLRTRRRTTAPGPGARTRAVPPRPRAAPTQPCRIQLLPAASRATPSLVAREAEGRPVGLRQRAGQAGHGQAHPRDDPGPRRGALGRLLRQGLRADVADRFDFDGFTLLYLSQCRDRLRARTDGQQGPHEPLRSRRWLRPSRRLGGGSRRRARAHARGGSGAEGHQGDQARRQRCSAGSSSSTIPTATRSRFCSGRAGSTSGEPGPRFRERRRVKRLVSASATTDRVERRQWEEL